ncbi:MAG: C25 family cysteine peptidase [Ignavibacterium sp.]|nr:C25 family cysteine peptidase [Ignavibacterium sp.]MDW8375662.1 C25 family cysteine peptidase [Ignavibacteriales bacterium]
MIKKLVLLSFIILSSIILSQNKSYLKIIESNLNYSIIECDFSTQFSIVDTSFNGIRYTIINDNELSYNEPGKPFLPNRMFQYGIPFNSKVKINLIELQSETYYNKFILPTPDSLNQPIDKLNYDFEIYSQNLYFPNQIIESKEPAIFRFSKFTSILVSPFQFNPVERKLIFHRKIKFRIDFIDDLSFVGNIKPFTEDKLTNEFINSQLVNSQVAINFAGKVVDETFSQTNSNYWYSPNKDWYKIYLNKRGVYRITFDQLVQLGINPNGQIRNGKLELYNNGEKIPIDIVDKNQDGVFNSGDYFQFVGDKVKPTPFSGLNIYNLTNVYWFSYQADSVYKYLPKNGQPENTFFPVISSVSTIHWEEDKIYDNYGYAPNDQRDYWSWGTSDLRNTVPVSFFNFWIKDSIAYYRDPTRPQSRIRVSLHGLTASSCPTAHNAWIKWNFKKIGESLSWGGQNSALIDQQFLWGIGGDSVYCSPDSNYIIVGVDSTNCNFNTDIIRINWVELDYWRLHKVRGPYFEFKNPPNRFGILNYYLYEYPFLQMKIYIPQTGRMITNPDIRNDADQSVWFTDTVSAPTEYFCVYPEYFLVPDSIRRDVVSDLRNVNNGVDYLIITHRKFQTQAQQLANFRSQNLHGFNNPRVMLVDVQDVYDEFNFGLRDPKAIRDFIKYAFDNYSGNTLSYVTLIGDMSRDYRGILPNSKISYMPSMPYHAILYGQLASDNLFACIVGNDFIPDLALGRISCEDEQEANILISKILNYPADNSKEWKKTVGLYSGGLNENDENSFKFNDSNIFLEENYLNPFGAITSKVFRYPNKPEYLPFAGSGPEIRQSINKGTVLVSYYGHGGGYQWDFVFTDDDIYALNNQNRLPFVISVTCYTSHFDNQKVFGEIFNSVPNKGSIATFGSSGVTLWPTAKFFNQELFREIFNNRRYTIGDAILVAKANPAYGTMTQVLTLLGDPAQRLALPEYPDFVVRSSDISISPRNPLVNDTVKVKIFIRNMGTAFRGDSVTVQLYKYSISDTNLIGSTKLKSFNFIDSTEFNWITTEDGLIPLIAVVNKVDTLMEIDQTDNVASASFPVFNISKPNIIKPSDNFFTSSRNVDFRFVDVGTYVQQNFRYQVVIDTTKLFNSSRRIISPILRPEEGIISWRSPQLSDGIYYWRAFIYSGSDTNYSDIKTFSIINESGFGFYAHQKQLLDFTTTNILYSDSLKSLILNTSVNPPYPIEENLLDSIMVPIPVDSTYFTASATDGTYIYFGNIVDHNFGRKSKIYKVGTGFNGTVKGQVYGTLGNLEVTIKNQMFYHSDGFLYVATGDSLSLLRINPLTADTTRIYLGDELLPNLDGLLSNSGYYVTSDGRYVYNLTGGYSGKREKYVLRKFDPQNNWSKVGEDVEFLGKSQRGFSNFFVSDGYVITIESFENHYMRKYRLDGFYEGEWVPLNRPNILYSIAFDRQNNRLYISTYKPPQFLYQSGFFVYKGSYVNASGQFETPEIGPALKFNQLNYLVDNTNSLGKYTNILLARSSNSQQWDTVATNIPQSFNLSNLPGGYEFIKMNFSFIDTSTQASEPLKFKFIKVDYSLFPEIHFAPDYLKFQSDTLMQGFDNSLTLRAKNIGLSDVDSVRFDFYFNNSDRPAFTTFQKIKTDSTLLFSRIIPTDTLLYTAPLTDINIKVTITSPVKEFYTFNNITENNFYVSRDSISPIFKITFDGREILNGDLISAEPEVIITLEDNSPLPLDTSRFSIIHNNVPIRFSNPAISFNYNPFPNSKAIVKWKPKLKDGRHILEVLAKDASNNYFDTVSYRVFFFVSNKSDMKNVYNYPNPFKDNTYFTFEIRGISPPEKLKISIFTIAGRLIREITVPTSMLNMGFNKVFWDGRDEDGDEIANGIYFYKITSKFKDKTITTTEKLSKIK